MTHAQPDSPGVTGDFVSFRTGGLRRKLMQLSLMLTMLGIALLFVSLVSVFRLRMSANDLVQRRTPALEAALRAQVGLERSLSSLRAWVALGDPRFREARRTAWKDRIEPAAAELEALAHRWPEDVELKGVVGLRRGLADLKESQWWVEDVAQSEGNDRGQLLLNQRVAPIAGPILRTARGLRRLATEADGRGATTLAEASQRFLVELLLAEKSVAVGVAGGDGAARQRLLLHLRNAKEALQELVTLTSGGLGVEVESVAYLAREWPWYQRFAEEAIAARQSADGNVAVYLMKTETVPLTQDIKTSLDALVERQRALMHQDSRLVETVGTAAVGVSLTLILLMGFLAYLVAGRRAEQISRPVVRLSEATLELVAGVLKEDLPITSNDEIGSLTAAFNKMRVNLDQSQAALQSAHDKMAIELERAAAYVRSILPEKIDDDASSIRTNWRYIASSQLGGDLLGYHELDERLTAIYLLDVSGHGVGSSLLAVSAHDTLRRRTLPGTRFERPAEVLAGLNDAFPMHQNSGKFFTIWYGVYDSATGELRYSAAGHHPAVLIESKPDGSDRALQLGEPNLMIGAFPEAEYEDETLQILPGSRLYLFSDGAYEIRDASREMLDYEGLERIITGVEAGSSAGRLDEILGALRAYQGRDEFVDDYSMLEVTFG